MSESSRNPPPKPTDSVFYFNLSGIPDAGFMFQRAAIKLGARIVKLPAPVSMQMMHEQMKKQKVAFSLVGPLRPDGMLAQTPRIGSVVFPPLVSVVPELPHPEVVEAMRRAGVSAIVAANAENAHELLAKLVTSGRWIRAAIEQVHVVDFLQSPMVGNSVQIQIVCPHHPLISDRTWDDAELTCNDPSAADCPGWAGRMYIEDQRVIHAETPTAMGIDAVSQMIALDRGEIMAQPIFLPPLQPNLNKSVQGVILAAAVLSDEQERGSMPAESPDLTDRGRRLMHSVAPSAPETLEDADVQEIPAAPPPPRRLSQEPSRAPSSQQGGQNMDEQQALDATMRRTGLKGMATCNENGWVRCVSGELDAETTCAVVTMSLPPLIRIANLLGLGQVQAWSVGGTASTIYACTTADGLIAAVGDTSKSAISVLASVMTQVKR